jgi:tripartite-type tricarboxylate transporter receptor subunit TctC
MKLPRRQFLHLAAGAAALPALPHVARAQAYPTRPITINVPFAPGGPTDTVARIISEGMRASLGQPVVIENTAGANGSIGVGRVARAAPDGYTLSIGHWNTHVTNGAVYPLQYDVLNDFAPIMLLVSNPGMIVAKIAVPANDLKSLIEWLKANPDKASQATAGVGSGGHITGAYFQMVTGTRFQFIHYRGAAPAMQDLLAGHVDLMIDNPITSLPQVRSGKIKAFAITANRRLPAAAEVPTVDEAGLPGMYYSLWHGIWAPKGTSPDVIAKLNAAIAAVLANDQVRARLSDLGQEVFPRDQQTPNALATFHKAEIDKWWPIIKAAGIKAE